MRYVIRAPNGTPVTADTLQNALKRAGIAPGTSAQYWLIREGEDPARAILERHPAGRSNGRPMGRPPNPARLVQRSIGLPKALWVELDQSARERARNTRRRVTTAQLIRERLTLPTDP